MKAHGIQQKHEYLRHTSIGVVCWRSNASIMLTADTRVSPTNVLCPFQIHRHWPSLTLTTSEKTAASSLSGRTSRKSVTGQLLPPTGAGWNAPCELHIGATASCSTIDLN
eukprot:8029190-Pyramimonas_sp.AAC.4